MTNIEELMRDPDNRAAASKTTRRSMFVFIATLLVMLYFSGTTSGIIGGVLFLAIGLFLIPLSIAVPSFMLQRQRPKLKWLFMALDVIATVVVTRALYLGIFG
ncbi:MULTISPECIES: hypothetical protein [Ferrimonas]|uniref:hypothetical protein n=1 Tax=Ferrimonas TaxID=44011 RepID=UPI00042133B7|nr:MULTISPECIES: hypothetical protein [Ferrimonas]USD36212.1 hypothetical protein J8Z22_14355 [Ferrimonas sp. SCSIO 43195]